MVMAAMTAGPVGMGSERGAAGDVTSYMLAMAVSAGMAAVGHAVMAVLVCQLAGLLLALGIGRRLGMVSVVAMGHGGNDKGGCHQDANRADSQLSASSHIKITPTFLSILSRRVSAVKLPNH